MTDDSDLGRLPRFARDVAVLSRDGHAADDHGVLPPFSGVLDVHVTSGHVPTLDLSYLTLGPLVVPDVARSRGQTRGSSTLDSAHDRHSGTGQDATSEEGSEPTVREVISDRGEAGDDGALDRSNAVLDTPRTRFDLGTGRGNWRSDAPDPSTRERPGPDAPPDAPARTTVDRSGADDSTAGSTDTADRTARTDDGSERSRDTTGSDDRRPRSTTPPGPPIASLDGIASPRMLTRRSEPTDSGRLASGTDAAEVAPPRLIPERPTASTDVGQSSSGASDRGGRDGSRRNAPRDATGGRPRMVVDRRTGSADRGDDPTGDATATARNASVEDDHGAGRQSGGHTGDVDPDERLAAVVEASTDPESRLVDRLYRALQEREAIERHRRGGR